MESQPVFFDPRGQRGERFVRVLKALLFALGLLASAFLVGLVFLLPTLPSSNPRRGNRIRPAAVAKPPAELLSGRARRELFAEATRESALPDAKVIESSRILLGFYAPWQSSTGLASLQASASKLTHVAPEWLHLAPDGTSLDYNDFTFKLNPDNIQVVDIAKRNGLGIWPILNNSAQGKFQFDPVRKLLSSTRNQERLADAVATFLTEGGFQGLNLDFENLTKAEYARLPQFLRVLRGRLAAKHLGLSADVEVGNDDIPIREIANECDWIVAMIYDAHDEEGAPGPIAPLDWCRKTMDRTIARVPSSKVVLGFGNYAYDWTNDRSEPTEHLTFQEALATAKGYREGDKPEDVVDFDEDAFNSHFDYTDDDDRSHTVWMLDAASAFNQFQLARGKGLAGAALWALGSEDPSIWAFFDRNKIGTHPGLDGAETVAFPDAIDYTGKGEILEVKERPQVGKRRLDIDPQSGLVTDLTYDAYPLPYVVEHKGYRPKELVLTFDDGPDPSYTPRILDELKRLGVPACFFVVGKNAEMHPELVRRMWDEGHEVGSHTFFHPNMSDVGSLRARLEIDATQRSIESILGRSTTFFRPPYNADSEPRNADELKPVELAARKGYLTIGEKIDPQDWNPVYVGDDGSTRPKTADDIVQSTLEQIENDAKSADEGNIILLHDAGGNREQTIKALPSIVESLRARGYKFVGVSSLLNKTREQTMPAIGGKERFLIFFDRLVFGGVVGIDALLSIAFLTAITLGFARALVILPLAIAHHRTPRAPIDPGFLPRVSVLVAAYNEGAVIARTIRSIQSSEYPLHEVIVVDDGSTDDTASVAERFEGIRVLRKPNGGKASALNLAISEATGDLMVCIDADTQLGADAIRLLVQPFKDSQIAAVAGNVRVGNVDNVLTAWQDVEYTTSQNLDRRAYALLNSITVVPGAIGAWRLDVVREVGGFVTDTLAEDMDLTWRVRAAGYRLETESHAIAYTEAPDTMEAFTKQRFRWTFGTLQCLWKHRRMLGKHGWFGRVSLPALWVFQIGYQALAPIVDFQVLYSLAALAFQVFSKHGAEVDPIREATETLRSVGFLYALFFAVELASGFFAYRLERTSPKPLVWLFLQRFVYRQILYMVVYRAFARAIRGGRQGWGKLDRKGTVKMPNS